MNVRARLRRGCLLSILAGSGFAAALVAAGCGTAAEAPALHIACPRVDRHPRPATGPLIVGLNSVWNDTCDLAAIAGAGVSMERVEVDWPRVEPAPGRWNWRHVDHVVAMAARHRIRVLPLLAAVPSWAGQEGFALPANPRGFASYTAHVVARYGPHGSFWRQRRDIPYMPAKWFEVWNEPYLPQFSAGRPNAAAYARLFVAAAAAGRRADPAARFLLAADTTALTAEGRQVPWVSAMYRAVPGLNDYFDGVAVHPYSAPGSPSTFTPAGDTRFQFRRIEQLRQMFVQAGAARKPFWITEIGWSTCPASPRDCVTEARQAGYLREVLNAVRTNYSRWVRAVFIYNFRDSPAAVNLADKERWFGLIRRDGSPKPAWRVLETTTRE